MKTIVTVLALFGLTMASQAQEQQTDTLEGKKVVLDEVFVSAIRVTNQTPVTFSNLTKEQIKSRNLGQDIPILMNFLPSVVTTSDAGAGIGYTSIRVRGTGAKGVNVTINGVPYNDAESQGAFWVNMPDFSSSTESLQLQRGVGTSTNGAGAFGASLNILTDGISEEPYAQISASVGSFNTLKNNIKFSTGLIGDHIEISGRLSKIASDGYIDRASSKLDSYFLQGAYKDDNTLIKALLFGGHEITYQAWYGTPLARINYNKEGIEKFIADNWLSDAEAENLLNSDRRYNYYTYENEVDNYKQDHTQLLWNEQLNKNWSSNIALHYTRGRGYYEQYKVEDDFSTYGFAPIMINGEEVNTTDIIRRKWLDNDFYGTVLSVNYSNDKLDFITGGGFNRYEGDHFGEVIWAKVPSNSRLRDRYYENNSTKRDFNIYTKANYSLNNKWSLFGDLQYRVVGYKANGEETGLVDDTFNFFNPKAGVTYDINKNNNLYLSYAVANREPNRTDYENGNPESEKLNDLELGWRYVTPDIQVSTNMYYMNYKNQLVLTGDLSDVGAPLRENIGDSYRLGLEVDANVALGDKFQWSPNIALSSNKNKNFNFQRDGTLKNLGDTNIAFSPNVVVGNRITYKPTSNFQISALTKYVGKQYMGNIDSQGSTLDAYSQSDLNVQYIIEFSSVIKSITLSALVNNVFNQENITNGYFYTYDDTRSVANQTTTIEGAGYYPQAGTNFLLGATISF